MSDSNATLSSCSTARPCRWWPWVLAIAVVVVDRVTKLAIIAAIPYGTHGIPVVPGLMLTHVHNRGIAFGLFNDSGAIARWVLPMMVVLSVVIIAWLAMRHSAGSRVVSVSFGLILGGAIGNLWDRLQYGWVVDFIHVWVLVGNRRWSWPDFNVADSAITVGATLLIIHELFFARNDTESPNPSDGEV